MHSALSETSFFFTPRHLMSNILYAPQCNRREGVVKDQRIGIRLQCCSTSHLGARQHLQLHVQALFKPSSPRVHDEDRFFKMVLQYRSMLILHQPVTSGSFDQGDDDRDTTTLVLISASLQESPAKCIDCLPITRKALQVQRWLSCEDFNSAMVDVYRYVHTQDNDPISFAYE